MTHLLYLVRRHQVAFGLVLMFALTWPIDLAVAAQSHGKLPFHFPEPLALTVGYGFVVAALLATAIVGGRSQIEALLRRYLIWRVGAAWYIVVLLGPVIVILLSLAIDTLLGGPSPDFSKPFVRQLVPAGVSLLIVAPLWLVFELLMNGEEIGWRGYVQPRLLEKHSALGASLLLAPVWAVWHVPKFLLAGTVGEAHAYPFWLFALNILAFTILISWVYAHTGSSLLLAALFHAASNTALMCLPVAAGERAFYIMIGVNCLWALIVVLATGEDLVRKPVASTLAPSSPMDRVY